MADQILSYILPNYNSTVLTNYEELGDLKKFNQNLYAPEEAYLADYGYFYVPSQCYTSQCNLHVYLHGCNGSVAHGGIKDHVVRSLGLLEHAVANDMIVLFPQVDFDPHPEEGYIDCWDTIGDTGPMYETNQGYMPSSLYKMIK